MTGRVQAMEASRAPMSTNRAKTALLALAAMPLLGAAPAPDPVKLNLEQETALRCSAAFALIAYDQQRKAPGWDKYPPLGTRGREYFVLTTADLMDQTGATREQVAAMFAARFKALQESSVRAADSGAVVQATLKPCLTLLDLALPARP